MVSFRAAPHVWYLRRCVVGWKGATMRQGWWSVNYEIDLRCLRFDVLLWLLRLLDYDDVDFDGYDARFAARRCCFL